MNTLGPMPRQAFLLACLIGLALLACSTETGSTPSPNVHAGAHLHPPAAYTYSNNGPNIYSQTRADTDGK